MLSMRRMNPQLSMAPTTGTPDPATRFWDRMARRYAAAAIADPAGYERTLERVAALLQPTDAVLEVGCGTGTTALRLAGGVRHWLGTDVSGRMLEIARAKLVAQPVPGLQFEQAPAQATAVSSLAFDAVLAFNVLHLVPDLPATLRALHRQLRPGGLFVSKTPCVGQMKPLLTHLGLPLMQALRLAPPVQCFRADALVAAVCEAGFVVEALERHGSGPRDLRAVIVARRR
jgi:SAM-dependent methyltransferase